MFTEHFKCQTLNFEVHFAPFPMKSSSKQTKISSLSRHFVVFAEFDIHAKYIFADFFVYISHLTKDCTKKKCAKKDISQWHVITMAWLLVQVTLWSVSDFDEWILNTFLKSRWLHHATLARKLWKRKKKP